MINGGRRARSPRRGGKGACSRPSLAGKPLLTINNRSHCSPPPINPVFSQSFFPPPPTEPPKTHRGDPPGLRRWIFGAYLWPGWEPSSRRSPSVTLSESVCHLAAGPGGFLYPPTTVAPAAVCQRGRGGARGEARGTVPGPEQKMSKRWASAGSEGGRRD